MRIVFVARRIPLFSLAAACGSGEAPPPKIAVPPPQEPAPAAPPAHEAAPADPVAPKQESAMAAEGKMGKKEPSKADANGDAFGAGGLDLRSVGEGGGGRGEGIGVCGDCDSSGAGQGTGQGFGNGHGRLGTGHSSPPTLRQGATQVNGALPPEVIQRIVRQSFGRFRLCYETGLRTNQQLQGRVAVKFEIDRSGAVASASEDSSDVGDATMVSCIVRAFRNLTFPQPERGSVTVVYPIIFQPGEAAAAPPPKPKTPAKPKK